MWQASVNHSRWFPFIPSVFALYLLYVCIHLSPSPPWILQCSFPLYVPLYLPPFHSSFWLGLAAQPRPVSNSRFSCLTLLSAGITNLYHHAQMTSVSSSHKMLSCYFLIFIVPFVFLIFNQPFLLLRKCSGTNCLDCVTHRKTSRHVLPN